MSFSDELIRENLLQYLYEVNRSAKSLKNTAVGILDMRRAMKEQHGYKQEEVVSNLSYLIDRDWVKRVIEEKEFTTRGGTTVHPKSEKFKISAAGIDYIQGPSKFQKEVQFANINIKKVKGVVVVGNNNIVNSEYQELYKTLEILQRKILEEKSIPEEQKLNIEMDLNGIKTQLSKPEPDKSIIKKLWAGIEKTVTAVSFVELIGKLAQLISPFLT